MEFMFMAAGLIIGFLLAYILTNRKSNTEKQTHIETVTQLQNQILATENLKNADIKVLLGKVTMLEEEKGKIEFQLSVERNKVELLSSEKATAEEKNKNILERLNSQKTEIDDLHKKLSLEFENISHRLFKTHSSEFRETSQRNLNDILNPLKEKIQHFEKKVEDTYTEEMKHRESLKTEVNKLFELNKVISDEAHNLTKALKGDTKTMGDWGEVILERILQQSGLEEGTMFEKQLSINTENNKQLRPDVIIYLPDNKHVVIDSKVSLVAYERYVNADSEDDKKKHLKEHIASVYSHISNLSKKSYQNLEGLHSPDFVLLFIPVEASFSLAIREDIQLFDEAWKNHIVIVSPTTLLVTLKTIQSIWKQEKQTKNAIEIAQAGGSLYDKFVGFIEDLEKVGKSISGTQNAYQDALNKLKDGKGNLINQTERLKKLGAKATKNLPDKYLSDNDLPLIEGEV